MLVRLPSILFFLASFSFISVLVIYSTFSKPSRINKNIAIDAWKANPASQKVREFWAGWAKIFDEARPTTKPIEIVWNASVQKSKNATGERKPTPQSIGLAEKDVESLRSSHAHVVENLSDEEPENDAKRLFKNPGVVTVAGGGLLGPAILSIHMLRRTNSTLPVQVFLQAHEFEQGVCEEVLPSLNAECYIFEDFLGAGNPFEVRTYQLKPLAILFSSFEQVAWIDADCIPLRDPVELLTSEPFLSTGLVTWQDYWIATEDPVFYKIAGLKSYPKGLPAKSTESGQLLIDKRRNLSPLLLATYYNIYGPGYFYQLLGQGAPGEGDKETFLASAVALGWPNYRVKHDLTPIGFEEEKTGRFHGKGMVQYHPGDDYAGKGDDVRPFFLHANNPKMNAGHLLSEERELYMPQTWTRIRIWGSRESNVKKFGFDVEEVVWQKLTSMACELQSILDDWKGKKRLCRMAKSHLEEVFAKDFSSSPN